jgi:hypothetical protein
MSVKYHGKNGLVYCSTSGSTGVVAVGGIRGFTLDGSQDDVDTTEFGDTNRTSVLGFPAFRGTLDGFWATDDQTIKSASQSTDGCHIYLYPSRNALARYMGGPSWLDMSINSAVDQAVRLAANFRARGSWINQL